jgi:hypothetical protein
MRRVLKQNLLNIPPLSPSYVRMARHIRIIDMCIRLGENIADSLAPDDIFIQQRAAVEVLGFLGAQQLRAEKNVANPYHGDWTDDLPDQTFW